MRSWLSALIVGLSVFAAIDVALGAEGTELLYVANSRGDDLTVIRLPDHKVIGSIAVGSHPHGLTASRDGKRVFVSVESDHSVLALDTATNEILRRVAVSDRPN